MKSKPKPKLKPRRNDDDPIEDFLDFFRAMTASPKQALSFISTISMLAELIDEPEYAGVLEDVVGDLAEALSDLEDARIGADREILDEKLAMVESRKTSDKEQPGDDLAESYFQHELMNETQAYIERGRRLEQSSDQDVLDAWVAAFEHGLEHRTIEDARNMEDAAAELRLRGLEEPHERVWSKIDALRAEMERLGPDAQLEGLDPQRIKDFLAALWGPKN